VYIRENIRNIESDVNKITKLRRAFSKIMDRLDNQGYAYIANHHGWLDGLCPHGPETDAQGNIIHNFLPWHRAYILKLEKLLQQVESDVSLPWWDWRSKRSRVEGIPKALSDTKTDNKLNPLNKFHMNIRGNDKEGNRVNINRDTFRSTGDVLDLGNRQGMLKFNQQDVPELYRLSDFRQFSERLRIGWHNFIHVWVGGDMSAVQTAAYDPIFYFHHCNVDRIWAIWQTIHGIDSVPPNMRDVILQPFKMTVMEVLDINSLGYEYASSTTN
jgi:Common central domain of tyrosinase.